MASKDSFWFKIIYIVSAVVSIAVAYLVVTNKFLDKRFLFSFLKLKKTTSIMSDVD